MRRREMLAGATALLSVAVAGCGHPDVVLDMDRATDEDIADQVSTTARAGSEEHRVLTDAIENGTSTREGQYALFDGNETLRLENTFYTLSETQIGADEEQTVYEVALDLDPENTTPTLGEIAFEDLPSVDRERLERLVTLESPPDQPGVDVGVDYGSASAVGSNSVFVPEQEYDILVHEGQRYRVLVESRQAPQGTYQYEVTDVVEGVATMAEQVRDTSLFTLEGLSEAEREVVQEAIDGGYFTDDEAFRSVVDRIHQHEAISREDFFGTWLIGYEGEEYITYVEW